MGGPFVTKLSGSEHMGDGLPIYGFLKNSNIKKLCSVNLGKKFKKLRGGRSDDSKLLVGRLTVKAEIFRVDRESVPASLAKISALPISLRGSQVCHGVALHLSLALTMCGV